jgi:hypothetical protein
LRRVGNASVVVGRLYGNAIVLSVLTAWWKIWRDAKWNATMKAYLQQQSSNLRYRSAAIAETLQRRSQLMLLLTDVLRAWSLSTEQSRCSRHVTSLTECAGVHARHAEELHRRAVESQQERAEFHAEVHARHADELTRRSADSERERAELHARHAEELNRRVLESERELAEVYATRADELARQAAESERLRGSTP